MRRGIERRRLELERLARNRAFSIAPNMIRDFQQRFDEATLRMIQAVRKLTTETRHHREMLHTRLVKVDLRQIIGRRREVVARYRQHLISSVRARLQKEHSRLELAAGRLDALSPLAILQRGYAICKDERGAILRDAASVSLGDRVAVNLAKGGLDCRVEDVKT